jgi:hypothetical protein
MLNQLDETSRFHNYNEIDKLQDYGIYSYISNFRNQLN